MSISSMSEDSALRLTAPAKARPKVEDMAAAAASAAATAAATGATTDEAAREAKAAVEAVRENATGSRTAVSSSPLTVLTKYIPTETITLYIAIQAAVGEIARPASGKISDADFTSRWVWLAIMLAATILLTIGLSYRSQKNANPVDKFSLPLFEMLAAGAAFLVWALSLPTTPLLDFAGYNYNAWNSVIILVGTVLIATVAYVLGKTVAWEKVADV
jgi:uncharacterized membrane protein